MPEQESDTGLNPAEHGSSPKQPSLSDRRFASPPNASSQGSTNCPLLQIPIGSSYTCRHTFAHRMLSGYWNAGVGCSIETLAELIGDTPKVASRTTARSGGSTTRIPLGAAIGAGPKGNNVQTPLKPSKDRGKSPREPVSSRTGKEGKRPTSEDSCWTRGTNPAAKVRTTRHGQDSQSEPTVPRPGMCTGSRRTAGTIRRRARNAVCPCSTKTASVSAGKKTQGRRLAEGRMKAAGKKQPGCRLWPVQTSGA